MFCPNCGNPVREGARFCGSCGTPIPGQEAPAEQTAPAENTQPEQTQSEQAQPEQAQPKQAPAEQPASAQTPPSAQPEPILRRSHGLMQKQVSKPVAPVGASGAAGEPILGRKRHGMGIIIGVVVAALAVIAALVFLIVPAVLQVISPKAYLTSCAGKTLAAYSEAWEKAGKSMGVNGLYDAIRDKRMSYTVDCSITDYPDMSSMNGSGFTLDAQFDRKGREIAADLGVNYGSTDLGSVQIYLKDDLIALGSLDYTDGEFYGIHTETLGQDINAASWGKGSGIDENLSFNVFDLLDIYQKPTDLLTAKSYAALGKEAAGLLSDSEVEKQGKKDKKINGERETLKMYTVTIEPEDLAARLYNSAEIILNDENLYKTIEPMLTAQAAQQDMTASEMFEETRDQILDQFDPDDIADSLEDMDIELVLGVRGKQIALAELSLKPDGGEKATIRAEIGTEESLINDLTIEASAGSPVFALEMSGDHEPKDGVFTDKTTITSGGSEVLTMETEWDTKADDDNFKLDMSMQGGSISMEGTLVTKSNSLDAQFDRVKVTSGGDSMTMSISYALATCKDFAFTAKDATILTDLSEDDIMEIAESIQENAQSTILSKFLGSSSSSGSSYNYGGYGGYNSYSAYNDLLPYYYYY